MKVKDLLKKLERKDPEAIVLIPFSGKLDDFITVSTIIDESNIFKVHQNPFYSGDYIIYESVNKSTSRLNGIILE
jgi:hypothetical protein